jgi:hypothetical protein
MSFDVLDVRTKPKGYFKLEVMELRIKTSLIWKWKNEKNYPLNLKKKNWNQI